METGYETKGMCVKCESAPAIMQVTQTCYKCYKEDWDKRQNFIDNEVKQEVEEAEEKTVYLSCSETAKLVRKALKENFPGQKFSVRSSVYSGGASIDVSWDDGVGSEDVERVIKMFEGAGFDGMIDLKFYKHHWMLPDGSVTSADSEGTAGSRGVYNGYKYAKPHPDAKRVSFGADYVFANRHIKQETLTEIAKQLAELNGVEFVSMDSYPEWFGEKRDTWWNIVRRLVYNKDLTGFEKVNRSGVDCGKWEDFYVLVNKVGGKK